MARLIKIDKNGSKHYEGIVKCDRCGGTGIYGWGAIINGRPQYAGTCFKCNGDGKVHGTWIERTPEYQAELDAKREARHEKARAEQEAKWEAIRAEQEAKRAAKEAEEKARKAISQYVGTVGERIDISAVYQFSGSWEQKSFRGFGTDTMYCHGFVDGNGNVLVWKTSKGLPFETGTNVVLSGTVKDHSEYKEEKQTALTRCKVTAAE